MSASGAKTSPSELSPSAAIEAVDVLSSFTRATRLLAICGAQEYGRAVKTRLAIQWSGLRWLVVARCVLGAFGPSSCGGSHFSVDYDSAGAGSEPNAGASNGGRPGDGEAGSGASVDEAGAAGATAAAGRGDAGDTGDGGHGAEAHGGDSGASNGGESAGAGTTAGGASGAAGGGGSAGAPASELKAFDDFVVSAEGWTVTGDDTTKTVKYSSTGGNPNGSISAEDLTTGTLFFTAPKKYLGDVSVYYGGELRFDLKAAATTGEFFAYADVELTSNQTTIVYDCTPNPTTSWHRYVVPLSETAWKLTTITGAAVTAAQFRSVLANLTRVRIRGEFTDARDTGYLDNVYLGSKAASSPGQ